jgi:hypothetical protein
LIAPTHAQSALGPALAVLCGALASGNWQWRAERLLDLVLVLFVAEMLWSTWRAILVDMDWSTYVAAHPLPEGGDAVLVPPYTTPWSPVGRLFTGWARLRRWMRQTLPVERVSALLTLPILPPLVLVISAAVNTQVLLLSLVTLTLAAIEWRFARRHKPHHSLRAASEIGLSWLAGHVVFSDLIWPSLALACSYALVYQGALSLIDSDPPPARRSWAFAQRSWALTLIYGGQSAALILLIALGHPIAALGLGVLGAPQLLLLAQPNSDAPNAWYLGHIAPFLMISMLIAAWAI